MTELVLLKYLSIAWLWALGGALLAAIPIHSGEPGELDRPSQYLIFLVVYPFMFVTSAALRLLKHLERKKA